MFEVSLSGMELSIRLNSPLSFVTVLFFYSVKSVNFTTSENNMPQKLAPLLQVKFRKISTRSHSYFVFQGVVIR